MKAMVLSRTADVGTAPLQLRELPIPGPGPGEILVRLTVCGICRTDLHVIEGELADPKLPLIPGHQAVGVVSQVGARA
jgi:alcohol dehydrogenase, propanol-preferring